MKHVKMRKITEDWLLNKQYSIFRKKIKKIAVSDFSYFLLHYSDTFGWTAMAKVKSWVIVNYSSTSYLEFAIVVFKY